MTNTGLIPVDFTTPVGQLRGILGDLEFIPLTDTTGDFTNFSDAQLAAFLATGSGNVATGAGYAYLTLAAQFAADSIKFTTDDEAVDLTARAESMRKLAALWFERGDGADAAAGSDFFEIAYPEFCQTPEHVELTQWPVRNSWWC